ncbi:MAG: YihY/virulence factor BrkB family protein [Alphaproteobacteria bacterium]|nr:YihY/virulence factor BrkB family protein [Alphaproteobacteria bacterium]
MRNRSRLSYYLHKYILIPLQIFRISIIDTIRHDGIEHAGYLAFLSILSLFPSLIFLIMIVGFFGASDAGTHLINKLLAVAPKEITLALTPRINEITDGPEQSFLTIAIIGVIWTASSSVEGCRTILNRAYRVAFPPPYAWRRFISIIEFFVIIFAMVSGIVIFVVVPNLLRELHLSVHVDVDVLYIRQMLIFFLLTCTTSLLYYALPNVKQSITQTIPGSILAVTLWILLVRFFEIYLTNFHQMNFVYGSLAGIIAALMLFYLISLIFIFGAEFNYHFHRTYQVFLKPNEE